MSAVWLGIAVLAAIIVIAMLLVSRAQKTRKSDEDDQRTMNAQVIAADLGEVATTLLARFQGSVPAQGVYSPEQMLQIGTLDERERDTLHVAHAQCHLFDDALRDRIVLVVRLLHSLQEHAEKSRDTWTQAPGGLDLEAYREQRSDSFDKNVSALAGYLKAVQAGLAAHLPASRTDEASV